MYSRGLPVVDLAYSFISKALPCGLYGGLGSWDSWESFCSSSCGMASGMTVRHVASWGSHGVRRCVSGMT